MSVPRVLAASAVLALGCRFDPSGAGGTETESNAGSTTNGPGPASGSTASGPSTSISSSTFTTSGGRDESTSAADTSSGATGGSESSTGAPSDPLVERGLLVRYFLDEADRGQEISEVVDSAPDPLNLPLSYSSEPLQPLFFAQGGNHGLEWSTRLEAGAAMINVEDTKVQTVLDGSTQGTIEVVADIDTPGMNNNTARFITVVDGVAGGDFGLTVTEPTGVWFRLNDATSLQWAVGLPSMGRVVLHLVMDTDAPSGAERAVLYIDGVPQASTSGAGPSRGETISVEDDDEIVIGNVSDESRSPDGRIFYAAMYGVALTPEEVATNVARLAADDDS